MGDGRRKNIIPGLEEHRRLLRGSGIGPIPGVCYRQEPAAVQLELNAGLAWGSLLHEPFSIHRFARVSSSSGELLLLLFFKNTILSQHYDATCRIFCAPAFFLLGPGPVGLYGFSWHLWTTSIPMVEIHTTWKGCRPPRAKLSCLSLAWSWTQPHDSSGRTGVVAFSWL